MFLPVRSDAPMYIDGNRGIAASNVESDAVIALPTLRKLAVPEVLGEIPFPEMSRPPEDHPGAVVQIEGKGGRKAPETVDLRL
ncbi:hypothetical protein [Sphingosinithalassobacter portus]|uniref:hypothetical protein n=1 Tax=Stakelama portus TaxID=2676234 RepID=UPI0011AB51C2|nr:hypothetical protein [Sphingosinithalassobacter portus]